MTAEEWLRARLASSPPLLLEAMVAALPAGSRTDVPETLAEGGLALYLKVVGGSGRREDALPLLAADALFTHAFEAQAELDPGGLAAFTSRWSGRERLARLVE
jgi:hypothetical protein